jgi:pyridoxamine 5'-phosphate oxidase
MNAEKDPFRIFLNWYEEAQKAGIEEPGMMTLATVGPDGRPSARMVLFKELHHQGLTFFTNYQSRKAGEMDQNPYISVVVYWPQLGYQIRVEGKAEKIPGQQSDMYFSTRPRQSQLGAWASSQSSVIPSETTLEARMLHYRKLYEGGPVPRPPYWGGYRLIPDRYEFWREGKHRLHSRVMFEKAGTSWKRSILAP